MPAMPQKRGVQEPEAGRGHFLEQTAEPADEIVRGEEVANKKCR